MINQASTITTQINTDSRQLKHSLILAISLVFSIIASQFISDEPFGLNFFITTIVCFVTVIFIRKQSDKVITKTEYFLMSSAIVISLFFVIRQSDVLYGLNILAILIIASIAFAQRYTGSILDIPMIAWLLTPFRLLLLYFVSAYRTIALGFTPSLFMTHKQKHIQSILLGTLWTLPILFILGSLLVSSDSRFEHFTMNVFSFDFLELFDELLPILLYFPLFTALFYSSLLSSSAKTVQKKQSTFSLEGIQLLTILTLVNLLFISYIFIQFSYFFGGDQIILEAGNQTYSSYARRGFWELILLAMIVLPLLLVAHWLQRNEHHSLQVWFNRAAVLTIVCLVIIEASAIHRMYLYVKIYNLTELRFYSSAFMFYMMGGLITFYLTVLKNQRGQFIAAMVFQTLSMILILNIINPDALISRYNLSHNQHKNIDTYYLQTLSTDAYAMIYHNIKSLDSKSSCLLHNRLNNKLKSSQAKTHQWNWSIHKAKQIISLWNNQCQNKK
ncbi:MAG: DUF4173 domain-containing protein [Gammaproteobacteria bacterium]|nr:DUF4173 domain-containing protein [Gammaproteobacteria bacterium]